MPRQRLPSPPLPGPPSGDRLEAAVRYSDDAARRRARSNRRPKMPPEQVLPTALEALSRANVAAECLAQALRCVRELSAATAPEQLVEQPSLSAAADHLTAAGSELTRARSELDRFLGRPTFLDGAKMTQGGRG